MNPTNDLLFKNNTNQEKKDGTKFTEQDKLNLSDMKFAQGMGASLRYANELHAVQQTGRLPFLQSSHLHEDVLRGNLFIGSTSKNMFADEESSRSRLSFL